jgi:hypothetical protein
MLAQKTLREKIDSQNSVFLNLIGRFKVVKHCMSRFGSFSNPLQMRAP